MGIKYTDKPIDGNQLLSVLCIQMMSKKTLVQASNRQAGKILELSLSKEYQSKGQFNIKLTTDYEFYDWCKYSIMLSIFLLSR